MKTRYYLPYILSLIAMTSCYHAANEEDITEADDGDSKTFTFHVKGDFLSSYTDMDGHDDTATTRASIRLEDNNAAAITDLWVLDYSADGTLLQQVHQASTDADFGHPTMSLTYGHHDVKFVASKGSAPSLSANTATASTTDAPHTIQWGKVKDTYTLDYPVDVVISSNGNRAPELHRAISGVKVIMTDAVPSGATSVVVTVANSYKSLSLPSLNVGAATSTTNTFDLYTTDVGQSLRLNTYTLSPTDTWQTDVTITAYKGSIVLTSITIPDVELKRNRMTELIGDVFSRGGGFTVSIEDAWDDAKQITF